MNAKKFRTSTGLKPRAFSSLHHSVMMMIVKLKVMVMIIHDCNIYNDDVDDV